MKTRTKGKPSAKKRPIPNRKGGRPVTEAQREVALMSLASGMSVAASAKSIGVDRSTVSAWLNDPANDFRARLDAELDLLRKSQRDRVIAATGVAIDALVAKTKKGHVGAAIALLKVGVPMKLEHAGEGGGAVKLKTEGLTTDELLAMVPDAVAALATKEGA